MHKVYVARFPELNPPENFPTPLGPGPKPFLMDLVERSHESGIHRDTKDDRLRPRTKLRSRAPNVTVTAY